MLSLVFSYAEVAANTFCVDSRFVGVEDSLMMFGSFCASAEPPESREPTFSALRDEGGRSDPAGQDGNGDYSRLMFYFLNL